MIPNKIISLEQLKVYGGTLAATLYNITNWSEVNQVLQAVLTLTMTVYTIKNILKKDKKNRK